MYRAVLLLITVLEVALPVRASADRPPLAERTAAFLFSYEVKPGLGQQFEDGYARHLDWHRDANDPLHWYGWYVTTGPNIGRFVDGTFGLTLAEFDARVDPAGDLADARSNLLPYVEPVDRTVWRRLADLGVADFLGAGERIRLLEARLYVVRPGAEARFEAAARERSDGSVSTWYELVVGGEVPAYLRLTPRSGFAGFDVGGMPWAWGDAVLRIETETWAMVDRLSYFPGEDEAH